MSRRLVIVWVALMVMTLASSDASSWASSTTFATIAVLAACAVKVALIGLEYMGLSAAPILASATFLLWTLGICVTLALFFLRPEIMPVKALLF